MTAFLSDSPLRPAAAPQAQRDPVCGMTVPASSPHRAELNLQVYGFCSAACRTRFLTNPRHFLAMGTPSEPGMGGSSAVPKRST